jgi:uncharacterized membrane protein YtjA (UPF0391 family)
LDVGDSGKTRRDSAPLHGQKVVASRLLSGAAPRALSPVKQGGIAMLNYALIFFVIALIAALLGFRGVAGLSAEFGWVFVVLAVVFLAVGLLTGRTPPQVP